MKRSLKIYEVMDSRFKKRIPKILLSGKWLSEAGFPANKHVTVECVTQGQLIISIQENHETYGTA